jgi:hypothetical protein
MVKQIGALYDLLVKQMGALYDLPVTKNKKPPKIFIEDVHLTCSPNLGHEQQ